jgi:hypothetical protein
MLKLRKRLADLQAFFVIINKYASIEDCSAKVGKTE